MNVHTSHLRAFVAVVDEGTFTDAAILLGTTQASVSRSVQRLESALGHEVLRRTTRRVVLAPEGERVLVLARRILTLVDQLGTSDESRLFRVAYTWAALGRHTVAVQHAWRDRHGRGLTFAHSANVVNDVVAGRSDAAVLRHSIVDPRLATAAVGTEDRRAVVAVDDPLAERDVLELEDFAGRVVAIDSASGTTGSSLWAGKRKPARFLDIRGIDDWLTTIAAGDAVGVSSEATAHQYSRSGVVFLPLRDAPPILVSIGWRRDAPPGELDDLLELCSSAFRQAGQSLP